VPYYYTLDGLYFPGSYALTPADGLECLSVPHRRSRYGEEKRLVREAAYWDRRLREKVNVIELFYFVQGEVLTDERGEGSLQRRNET